MRLVHAALDDAITMMFQETGVKLFEENLHKVIGKARSQDVRDSQDRGQQICTAQDFYNMRQDPYAILLQTKEALFPASHIPKSRSSFKPPPAKKQKKTNQPMAKNNTPSTTLHMLEEQIEIARKVMNSKVKEVEQVQVPMCPIIRNPEAISDDEIPDLEVKAAQVQVPQMIFPPSCKSNGGSGFCHFNYLWWYHIIVINRKKLKQN